MKIVKVCLIEILALIKDQLISIDGINDDVYIDNLADTRHVTLTTLDWVNPSKENKQEIAENSSARVVLVDSDVEYSDIMFKASKVLIHVQNPKIALAQIGNHFFSKRPKAGIHPTAIISTSAKIGKNVCIGPYFIVENSVIGDDSIIEANVHIYDDVEVGRGCVIKSGAVIGGEGFGFERDKNGNRFRFPQIGDVKIGNYVEVGANTCIDRGALSTTMIGDYTKINNLCHIAHNNVIGKNVIIAAEVNVSGGNIIEDDVWVAPSSSLRGYLKIGEGATVGMGAIAVKNIPANEVWVGNPARKLEKH